MPWSVFSEDEFEQNLLCELRDVFGASLPHFKPSRVLENYLGYDFAVATDYGRLARRGVFVDDPRLVGALPIQQRALMSRHYVTSFVQCKRPFWVTRGRGAFREHFHHWREPFYRFEIEGDQNQLLAATEATLGAEAVVRYATPCFWQREDSDLFVMARHICQRTHFVSPSRLQGHNHYTYVGPVRPGRAFSDPADINPEPFLASITASLAQSHRKSMAAHVLQLWSGLTEVGGDFGIRERTRDFVSIAARLVSELGDLPLDPFGRSEERGIYGPWPDGRKEPTILSFVAATIGVELASRDIFHATALTFTR